MVMAMLCQASPRSFMQLWPRVGSTCGFWPDASVRRLPALAAEAGDAVQVLDSDEQDVEEMEEGEEAATTASVPAFDERTPLFQELNVSNRTRPDKLMGVVVALFNRGQRAVDLVLIDPRCKSTLLYALRKLPDKMETSAIVLTRRRDRRFRVRVIQRFRPPQDAKPEILRIPALANVTKLGRLLKGKLVSNDGDNVNRTVTLQCAGKEASSRTLMTIEHAAQLSNRELAFQVGSRVVEPEDGSDGAKNSNAGGNFVLTEVHVTCV